MIRSETALQYRLRRLKENAADQAEDLHGLLDAIGNTTADYSQSQVYDAVSRAQHALWDAKRYFELAEFRAQVEQSNG